MWKLYRQLSNGKLLWIIKQEMYYGEKFSSIDELDKAIEQYIYWYNIRIKEKLNGLSPIEYRQKAA